MGLRINTNIQALSAQRSLGNSYAAQNKSLERLSSGNRINRGADDAAGLAISEKLKANIRSMKQATRNAQDGISLVQVAEGSMNEISNILVRLRELSIQASSDTIGDTERGFVDKEVQSLKDEINRISASTEYNGTKLLDGSAAPLDIQVGINNNAAVDRFQFDTPRHMTTVTSMGLDSVATTRKEDAQNNLESLDTAIVRINSSRSDLGAMQNRLQSTINNSMVYQENLAEANSRIRDTDMAEETSNMVKNNILTQAGISVLSQANTGPQLALKLLG